MTPFMTHLLIGLIVLGGLTIAALIIVALLGPSPEERKQKGRE